MAVSDAPMLLRPREVARLLGIGRTKVYDLLSGDEFPVIRLGRSVRVPRAALEQWIERHSGEWGGGRP